MSESLAKIASVSSASAGGPPWDLLPEEVEPDEPDEDDEEAAALESSSWPICLSSVKSASSMSPKSSSSSKSRSVSLSYPPLRFVSAAAAGPFASFSAPSPARATSATPTVGAATALAPSALDPTARETRESARPFLRAEAALAGGDRGVQDDASAASKGSSHEQLSSPPLPSFLAPDA